MHALMITAMGIAQLEGNQWAQLNLKRFTELELAAH